jgi:hypothetical protein
MRLPKLCRNKKIVGFNVDLTTDVLIRYKDRERALVLFLSIRGQIISTPFRDRKIRQTYRIYTQMTIVSSF